MNDINAVKLYCPIHSGLAGRVLCIMTSLGAGGVISACNIEPISERGQAKPAPVTAPADPVVARVNNTPLLMSELRRAALDENLISADEGFGPQHPIFGQVLNAQIDQYLLSQDAVNTRLDKQPDVARRLQMMRRKILSRAALDTYIDKTVTREAMLALFDAQSNLRGIGEERRVRHIVLASLEEAQLIVERLEGGEDFETLAAEKSLDQDSRALGGALGFISRDMRDPVFANAVFNGEIGARLPPFETSAGWHIVEIEDQRVTPPPEFEAVKDNIRDFLVFDAIDRFTTELRATADIDIEITPLGPVVPGPPSAQNDPQDEVQP